MDEDSALVLLRAAWDADPRFLPAHLDYLYRMLEYGERRRLPPDHAALASSGGPFFTCLALIIEHYGDPDREAAELARLDSAQQTTGCSATRRLALVVDGAPTEADASEFDQHWRRAVRYAPDVYWNWNRRALGLRRAQRWDEARAVLREAIRRFRHPILRVHSYLQLAALERQAGDWVRSEEIRRATERAVLRDGRRGLEWAYLDGLTDLESFLSGPSGPQLRDSVAFRRLRLALSFGHWTQRLYALYWAAVHLQWSGERAAVLPYVDYFVALADSVTRPLAQLQAYTARGRVYLKMGRLAEAERDLLRAVTFGDEAAHPRELGEAYHNLAHVYESAGRLVEAARAADRWIAIVGEMRSFDPRIMAYRDAGMIRWKAGWHVAASEAFTNMVSAIEELGTQYHWGGEYFERVGDFARALSYYRLGVQVNRAGELTLSLAGLARMYEALGFPDSAEAAAREHDSLLDHPWAVPLLPRLLVRRGRGGEAIILARAWVQRRMHQSNVEGAARALLELSELLLDQQAPRQALAEASRAAQLAEQNNLTDELIRARRLAGVAQVRLGNAAAGIAALTEAAALGRAHPTTDAVRETQLALADALAETGRVSSALDAYDLAARAVEQVIGHLAEDLDRARYRARQLAPFDGALRLLLRQPDSEGRSRGLVVWSQRRKAAALALGAASGSSGAGIRPAISAETLRRRLGKREALIDYLLVDGSAAAMVGTRAGVRVKRLDVPLDSLRRWIDELTWPLAARSGGLVDLSRLTFDIAAARRLYAALIGPLEPLLAGKTRITIVPDGVLYYLPFEALVLPAGADDPADRQGSTSYLLDRYEIVYRPSSQFLAARGLAERNVLGPRDRVLVLASTVPGEGAEVTAIRGAWGQGRVSVLAGNAATETAALHAGPSHGVLHFAVHAAADDRDPLRSHLRLVADAGNDGYLYLSEIAASRTAAKLVVLSGCETLSGRLYEGEGLMGLARAFLASGGREVLATRWPVGAPTAELMRVFYGRLAAGTAPATALREAKLALRRNPTTTHPFFWAGFALLSAA